MNIAFLNHKGENILRKPLAHNTLWMVLTLGLRFVLQAVYFIIIARTLGAEQYGAFVSAVAIVAIISPFASLGIGNLLIKNVSRNRETFEIYWGNALFVIFAFGLFWIALLVPVSRIFMPQSVPLGLILLIAISDLLFAKVIDTAGKAYQAIQRLSRTGLINTSINAFRMIAALLVIYFYPDLNALDWGFYYLSSTLIAAILAVLLVHRDLGYPKLKLSRLRSEIAEGFFFSLSIAGQNVYNVIDKIMLARLSTLEATGIYGAAYRLIEVVLVPVRALLQAAYAKFFKYGESGISGSLGLARRLSPIAGLYGLIAALGLFFLAPVVPLILGEEYQAAVNALRWLAPIPFIKSMHFFASDTLSGAGYQGIRSVMLISTALVNIIANLWLIPIYSWKGAIWASLMSNVFLMMALWTVVVYHYRREIRQKNC
jgi:O-antigen/teichoic acid export membrane protein